MKENNPISAQERTAVLERKQYEAELVKSVEEDFNKRQSDRYALDAQWRLNINFLAGNQNVRVNSSGEVVEENAEFDWQSKETYNHVAPIVETRLAKLNRVRPTMSVRASSGSEADIQTAKLSSKILTGVCDHLDFDSLISEATTWSEVCGTAFYKIVWNPDIGAELEDGVHEGGVEIVCCPPYEIYPDNPSATKIADMDSILHARVLSAAQVKRLWGVDVKGAPIDVFSLDGGGFAGRNVVKTTRDDAVRVIEKYVRPSSEFPLGRLIIVAGGKLLHDGELPFALGDNGERTFPFVRQVAIERVGSFWGTSVIDRIIPVQRAYNAVKNRKYEFLSRVAAGVLAVEDGSVDLTNLEEEGLTPGKVLVYRQGANPPTMMSFGNVPVEFSYEEDRLENELIRISGVSEIMRNSFAPTNVSSGVALQLLIEQDDTRLSLAAELIRRAIRTCGKFVLRLFKQFAGELRLMRLAGADGNVEVFYFSASDISSDDVVLETENELNSTPAQKRNMILELLSTGLLSDSEGKIDERNKSRILDLLGFGSFGDVSDVTEAHRKRALEENLNLEKELCEVSEFDDHAIHIAEHTRHVLSVPRKSAKTVEPRFAEHIRAHRTFAAMETTANGKDMEG